MKRLRTIAVVGALLAIIGMPLAYAAGLWFGLPVVGGAAYCAGSTTAGVPGTTATCNTTAPAGPTAVTGQELIPADLNPQGTQALYPGPGAGTTGPQTAYLPLAIGASGAYQIVDTLTPTVTSTWTIQNGVNTVYANATGTQTYLGLVLPVTPTDGQIIRIAAAATISTISFLTGATGQIVPTATRTFALYPAGSGGGAGASVTGTYGVTYMWSAPISTWLRIQ